MTKYETEAQLSLGCQSDLQQSQYRTTSHDPYTDCRNVGRVTDMHLQKQVVICVVFIVADMAAASRLGGGLGLHPSRQALHVGFSSSACASLLLTLHTMSTE